QRGGAVASSLTPAQVTPPLPALSPTRARVSRPPPESRLTRAGTDPVVIPARRPRGDLCSGVEAQLQEDVGNVAGRGGRADHEFLGDGFVAEAPGDQGDDLALTRGQPVRGGCGGAGGAGPCGRRWYGQRQLDGGAGLQGGAFRPQPRDGLRPEGGGRGEHALRPGGGPWRQVRGLAQRGRGGGQLHGPVRPVLLRGEGGEGLKPAD